MSSLRYTLQPGEFIFFVAAHFGFGSLDPIAEHPDNHRLDSGLDPNGSVSPPHGRANNGAEPLRDPLKQFRRERLAEAAHVRLDALREHQEQIFDLDLVSVHLDVGGEVQAAVSRGQLALEADQFRRLAGTAVAGEQHVRNSFRVARSPLASERSSQRGSSGVNGRSTSQAREIWRTVVARSTMEDGTIGMPLPPPHH